MKNLILIISCFFLAFPIKAQDMSSYFVSIPDSLLPQLESEWRKDLVELYESGKEARLQNLIGNYSTLEKLTSDYLLLHTSDKGRVEMKLLPLVNNTYVICTVNTIQGPVEDSRVNFFTTEWLPLVASDLYTPVTKESFLKEGVTPTDEGEYLLKRLDMDLVKYDLSPDDLTLTAHYMTPYYLTKEEREKVLPYLKEEPKKYTWNKSYFK